MDHVIEDIQKRIENISRQIENEPGNIALQWRLSSLENQLEDYELQRKLICRKWGRSWTTE